MSIDVHHPDPTGFDPSRLAWLEEQMQRDVDGERCDGVSVLVGHRGHLVASVSAGYAHRDEGRAMEADSVCVCFSSGKQFVNTLALRAVERGLLGLTQPIHEVLPAFANRGKETITLAHLLTHTSGICTGLPPVAPEVMLSIDELTAWAAASRPETKPGSRVSYSAIVGHAVIASLLLAVEGRGRNFATYLDEELFAPLGMTRTALGVPDRLRELAVNPVTTRYHRSGMFHSAEVEGVGALTMAPGAEIPAGGYVTTAQDMYRFAFMLAQGGEANGTRIVSPAMLELARQNHTGDVPNDLLDYSLAMRHWSAWPGAIGLGYFVRVPGLTPGPLPNLGRPGTFGGWGSGTSCFWIDPSRKLCFAMLTVGSMEDTDHIQRTQRLSDSVIAAMVD